MAYAFHLCGSYAAFIALVAVRQHGQEEISQAGPPPAGEAELNTPLVTRECPSPED